MARSDLLVKLVKAWATSDKSLFKNTVEAMVTDERSKNHHILADRLLESLRTVYSSSNPSTVSPSTGTDERIDNMLMEIVPRNQLKNLVLSPAVSEACNELIEEQMRIDVLRSYNLEPRHRILLTGPPGNGKTSLAEGLAESLMVPLFVVRYEGVIGSYLGETSLRIQRLFDHIRTHNSVLFFDEFDAIGKERGDEHETGEIKRVVSSLLLQIDRLPSHVVIVAATNHPELLDRAVWRRFQLRLSLDMPGIKQIEEWIVHFSEMNSKMDLKISPKSIAEKLHGLSYAEIREFFLDVQRRYVLQLPNDNVGEIVRGRIKQLNEQVRLLNIKEE